MNYRCGYIIKGGIYYCTDCEEELAIRKCSLCDQLMYGCPICDGCLGKYRCNECERDDE